MLLGVQDLKTEKDGSYQRLKIESADVHEQYSYSNGIRGYFDVAVLTLNSDIKYYPLKVQPICLPYKVVCTHLWSCKLKILFKLY